MGSQISKHPVSAFFARCGPELILIRSAKKNCNQKKSSLPSFVEIFSKQDLTQGRQFAHSRKDYIIE